MSFAIVLIPLLAGWLLDLWLGDPASLPHPVVYMGKWIAGGEHRLNRGGWRRTKGAVFALVSIMGVFLLWRMVEHLLTGTWALVLLNSVVVFFCLAGHTLRQEVRLVFQAVDRSTEEGRRQVARIVGRDTSELSPQEIRTAALETLAENLSDGVIAPLFWYGLLGAPGMLAYKMVNTLDSMIGYQTERYLRFGCWAAHLDDVANYLPARLTAVLMVVATADYKKLGRRLCFVWHYGPQHASPNSGYPEAALAGILDCRFGGPHYYFGEYFYKPYIGEHERPLTTQDMHRSIRLCFVAECLAVIVAAGLIAAGCLPLLSV